MNVFSNRKNTYSSRWGLHPCDHDTYKKLKKLRGYFFIALSRHKAWERWHKRLSKNNFLLECIYDENGRKKGHRKIAPIPEPVLCPVFSKKHVGKKYFDDTGYVKDGIDVETQVIGDWGVLDDYRRARIPLDTNDQIQPLELTVEQINSMLKEAEEWHASS